ncbi:MAG: hypothetical protein A2498_15185 [Lentisphaerae bacterium RIFOXYC12_FULL_60_16]|nr:MAG: hypothetical protein A2498_15185 [Lentisphaerae bacterium RIFOXYC12_FULL_60_16]
MKTPVIILYNLPAKAGTPGVCPESDRGVLNAVKAVEQALQSESTPCRRVGIRILADIALALSPYPHAVVFNLVERLDGDLADYNLVPAVCRALHHPVTGNDTAALQVTHDKWVAKARFQSAGVNTPAGMVIPPGAPPSRPPFPLRFPVLVKPVSADGSEGIAITSIIHRQGPALQAAIRRIHRQFHQPALIEEFIAGREFNISIIQDGPRVRILPLAEIDFSLFPPDRPHVVDYQLKWHPGTLGVVSPRKVPANVDSALAHTIRHQARLAWQAAGCRDYVRVDSRVDTAGIVFVLEVNANPDLAPLAGLPATLHAAGIPFATFVRMMIHNAMTNRTRPLLHARPSISKRATASHQMVSGGSRPR